jgi:hypothetical protein
MRKINWGGRVLAKWLDCQAVRHRVAAVPTGDGGRVARAAFIYLLV